jgi:hypothetical protein
MNDDSLEFIKSCIQRRKILWTYHVNMRLKERFISRDAILDSWESYEVIEQYPDDKYLPSYLVLAQNKNQVYHVHVAVDRKNDNVRIVTAYKPSRDEWEEGFEKRRRT